MVGEKVSHLYQTVMSTSKSLDFNISLCLACSSSLPPRSHEPFFTTQCCNKPICASCISNNPRLARYNPCLACLGGVEAIGSRSSGGKQLVPPEKVNIDGAVRDEDTFILGDDEDSEEEGPPPYLEQTSTSSSSSQAVGSPPDISEVTVSDTPHKYHIRQGDSLHGIALRFGVNVSSHTL